jgi:hypothetical protein
MMSHRIRRLVAGVRGLLRGIEESEGFVAAAPTIQIGEIFRHLWPYARPYRSWVPVSYPES